MVDLRQNSIVFLCMNNNQLGSKNKKEYPIHKCNKLLKVNNNVKYGKLWNAIEGVKKNWKNWETCHILVGYIRSYKYVFILG